MSLAFFSFFRLWFPPQAHSPRGGGLAGLPRAYHTTVSSLSTTTFEFLRHFWSSLLPPKPNDQSAFALAPPKDRALRVEKFKAYLEKSRERVDRAMDDARRDGGSDEVGRRVEAALRPVREAIDAALDVYAQRMGTGPRPGSARATPPPRPRPSANASAAPSPGPRIAT